MGVTNQFRSSRVFAPLTGWHGQLRPNTEGAPPPHVFVSNVVTEMLALNSDFAPSNPAYARPVCSARVLFGVFSSWNAVWNHDVARVEPLSCT
jgi:hypothetical protein